MMVFLMLFSIQEIVPAKVVIETQTKEAYREVKRIIKTKKNVKTTVLEIKKDSLLILNHLIAQGYIDASVVYKIKKDTVVFLINEGKLYVIKEIKLPSLFFALKKEYEGKPFKKIYTKEIEDKILEEVRNQGYLYAEVKIEKDIRNGNVYLNVILKKGKKVYIKNIVFLGAKGISLSFLRKLISIKPGDVYSKKKIEESRVNLYVTKLFRFVDVRLRGAQQKRDSIECVFLLKTRKTKALSLGFGFEIPNRCIFNISLVHRNLLRRGVSLGLNLGYMPSFTGDYEIKINIDNIYPKTTPLKVDFYLRPFWNIKKELPYFYHEVGGEGGGKIYFLTDVGFSASLMYKKFIYVRSVPEMNEEVVNLFHFGVSSDTRNDFFNPYKGGALFSYVDLAGWILDGDYDFLKYFFEIRRYFKIFYGMVLALRGRGGIMFPYGRNKRLPVLEEFTLGGYTDLRGYKERSVGPDSFGNYRYGSLLVNANAELRSPYFHNFGVVFFLDSGDLVNEINKIDLKTGIGIGIRYNSPIGPIRLDYGKNPFKPWKEDKGRLHLALLQMF